MVTRWNTHYESLARYLSLHESLVRYVADNQSSDNKVLRDYKLTEDDLKVARAKKKVLSGVLNA